MFFFYVLVAIPVVEEDIFPSVLRLTISFLTITFFISDVIRVWDSLFADEKRFEFLIYVCCAMHM